jgi:hypothetical protein
MANNTSPQDDGAVSSEATSAPSVATSGVHSAAQNSAARSRRGATTPGAARAHNGEPTARGS